MDYKRKLELTQILLKEMIESVTANFDERVARGVERYKDYPIPKPQANTSTLARYYQRLNLKYDDIIITKPEEFPIYTEAPEEIFEIFYLPEVQYYWQWGINTYILSAILERM